MIGATWDQVDLKKSIWTILASRMKARKERLVVIWTCIGDFEARARAAQRMAIPRHQGREHVGDGHVNDAAPDES